MTVVCIVGGGLVGSLAAIHFAQRPGYKVKLYERRPDIRKVPAQKGKSINLALSTRGITALQRGGVDATIFNEAIPMSARMIHVTDPNVKPYPQSYGGSIFSVDRRLMNQRLLDCAETFNNIELIFEHECLSVDCEKGQIVFRSPKKVEVLVQADLIIGADGAYSVVRRELCKFTRVNFSQSYVPHGYKELTIPPTASGDYAMPANYLHIWPRKDFMLIALPNQDRSFTCTCFFKYPLFDSLKGNEKILSFFKQQFPDAVPLIGEEALLNDFSSNPELSLVSVKCEPYHYKNKVLIIGDAAHAMVPFYGQGMNCGFEDITFLSNLLDEFKDDLNQVLPAFTARRKDDLFAITELADGNYTEMSTKVLSKYFAFEKSVVSLLSRLCPRSFAPHYYMVAFTGIPYSQVLERKEKQERFVKKLLVVGGMALAAGFYFGRKVLLNHRMI